MKLKLLLSVLFLTVFVVSCQNEESVSIKKNEFESVGIEHNKALDAVFLQLQQLKAENNGVVDIKTYLNFIEKKTVEYVSTTSNVTGKAKLLFDAEAQEMNRYMSELYSGGNFKYFESKIIQDVAHLMTENQKYFTNKIMENVNSGLPVNIIVSNFEAMEQEVYNTCDEYERASLLSGIAVGKHSVRYWESNFAKWDKEFNLSVNNPQAKTQGGVNGGVVAAADVAAGVTTGVLTSTALCVPFIGWGAWAAITGGSAAITSIGSALIMWTAGSQRAVYVNSDGITIGTTYAGNLSVMDYLN